MTAEVFYAYGQTDGLIEANRFAFRNFANAPLKPVYLSHTYNVRAKHSVMRFIRIKFVKTCSLTLIFLSFG
jgi:hypothetical protein